MIIKIIMILLLQIYNFKIISIIIINKLVCL